MKFPYHIVNVFAESAWGGNPLAIVPLLDVPPLDENTMQLLARQFNLSETVFIMPPTLPDTAAHLRIFTPEYEMPFAGHPTIGAAYWLHRELGLSDDFDLTTPAKTVAIHHADGVYRLTLSGYVFSPCGLSRQQLARGLGLSAEDVGAEVLWMNAGTWQFLVPLRTAAAVHAVRPRIEHLADGTMDAHHVNVYVWHEADGQVSARFFFSHHGALVEDPGTGSACANLGAWAHRQGRAPLTWRITQAAAIDRPNHLYLNVNAAGEITVGGRVRAFAEGELSC